MSNTSEFITIIRPSFMKFCGNDACRAAAFNHLLFRIAGKSKDQPKAKIQAGDILWYARTEQITEEMSKAWGVCKVRQEVNALIKDGLIGKRSNPHWGADRTKHFCFGTEQCVKFLDLCQEHNLCVIHLGLSPEVMHLIYSSNANDKSIKCICSIHQMETMELSNAFDKSIEAITIDSPTIDDTKEESTLPAIPASPTASPSGEDAHALSLSFKPERKTDVYTDRALVCHALANGQSVHPHTESPATAGVSPALGGNDPSPAQMAAKEQADSPIASTTLPTATAEPPKAARKPRAPKVDDGLQARIERVYDFFDTLGQEVTEDTDYHYRKTKKATEAIVEWLKSSPTEAILREVYLKLWDMPADTRTGFNWRDNMSIGAVLSQYDRMALSIKASRKNGKANLHLVASSAKESGLKSYSREELLRLPV